MTPETPHSPWPRPAASEFHGTHVLVSRLDPDRDIDDLYAVSHGSAEDEAIWTYLWNGPFASRQAMHAWLRSVRDSQDPLFYAVHSLALRKTVGVVSILNIVPEMGRAELG